MQIQPRLTQRGNVEPLHNGWKLVISKDSKKRYKLAQLDDHNELQRSNFPWRAPLKMSLRAKVSACSLPGTWGFGFWNDPYGFPIYPAVRKCQLPALPQAAWFFYASANNYLSFRDDLPANGHLAQVFRSPRCSGRLFPAAFALTISPRYSRRLLSSIIRNTAIRIQSDPCNWHIYQIEWREESTSFWVDDLFLMKTELSPMPPLGLVIWIDNQFASFEPTGRLMWGIEESIDQAWLEIADLTLET